MKSTKLIAALIGSAFLFGMAIDAMAAPAERSSRSKRRDNSITMAGSTTVLPIAQRCAEVFMENHPECNISVRGGGSSIGISAIIAGSVDIGNASRQIQSKEMILAKSKGKDIREIVVARDGLAIAVNKDNPVHALNVDQVRDIFMGKYRNWKDLGGKNMPIVVVSRDTSSGTFETFKEKVLKGGAVTDGSLMLPSNQAVGSTVAQTPGGIGYVGIGFITDDIKALNIEGVTVSVESIRNGRYKISRKLYMYVNAAPTGLVKQFLDFVLSAEGQKIVQDVGYVAK